MSSQQAQKPRACAWQEHDDGPWTTSCGHIFQFTEDGPKENGTKFCCYCGKPLIVVPYKEPQP